MTIAMQKVSSDQNKIDSFEQEMLRYEGEAVRQECQMDHRFDEIKDIAKHTDEQFQLMQAERKEI